MTLSEKSSADKILDAATELFSTHQYNDVSLKDISALSGANSALISYYYGCKKNLYQTVLNGQLRPFSNLMNDITTSKDAPADKLKNYVSGLCEIQRLKPQETRLIFREIVAPSPLFDEFFKAQLYKIHRFTTNIVASAIESGAIKKELRPEHIAFTIESIISLYFLAYNRMSELAELSDEDKAAYLETVLNNYLSSVWS